MDVVGPCLGTLLQIANVGENGYVTVSAGIL